ncbi:hypothetical protein CSB20_07400 [bacterium DOLZORAL124_64_63]|nr:MAG: hypothetical protein CSB20_07400 [bacterium DOLZORAL124_64_63]
MLSFFSLQSIPELRPMSAEDRQRVWSMASKRALMPWFWLVGCLLVGGGVLGAQMLSATLGLSFVLRALALILGLAIGNFLFFTLWVRKARKHMADVILEMNQHEAVQGAP